MSDRQKIRSVSCLIGLAYVWSEASPEAQALILPPSGRALGALKKQLSGKLLPHYPLYRCCLKSWQPRPYYLSRTPPIFYLPPRNYCARTTISIFYSILLYFYLRFDKLPIIFFRCHGANPRFSSPWHSRTLLTISPADPTMTADSLDYIINHVFLPPQLPQSGDDLSGENNSSLLKLLHFTAFQYSRQFTGSAFADSPWPRTVKMLRHFERFENTDSFSANTFTDAIYGMIDGGERPPPFRIFIVLPLLTGFN